MMIKRLAIFCGSSKGTDPEYVAQALKLTRSLHENGIDIVYGGGKVGLMGIVADEMMRLGGKVIGIIPEKIFDMEVGHNGISELKVVQTMHQRKEQMANLSDGFIALPGGIGTLEEIIEVFTWNQLGYHQKPCAFLNSAGYYDHLVQFFDEMVNKEFLKLPQRNKLLIEQEPSLLIHKILNYA